MKKVYEQVSKNFIKIASVGISNLVTFSTVISSTQVPVLFCFKGPKRVSSRNIEKLYLSTFNILLITESSSEKQATCPQCCEKLNVHFDKLLQMSSVSNALSLRDIQF